MRNAVKFTNEGTISIAVLNKEENRKEAIVVSVKDSGSGIDPEVMPRLFEKFVTK